MYTAWTIFNTALHRLAGPGPQRARLAGACGPAMLSLNRKELPRERREEFDALVQLFGAGGRFVARDVEEVVAALTDAQIAAATRAILSICDQLTRYEPIDAPRAAPAPDGSAEGGPQRQPGARRQHQPSPSVAPPAALRRG
nr:hypothetical protein [uncultured Duganella sp.]